MWYNFYITQNALQMTTALNAIGKQDANTNMPVFSAVVYGFSHRTHLDTTHKVGILLLKETD